MPEKASFYAPAVTIPVALTLSICMGLLALITRSDENPYWLTAVRKQFSQHCMSECLLNCNFSKSLQCLILLLTWQRINGLPFGKPSPRSTWNRALTGFIGFLSFRMFIENGIPWMTGISSTVRLTKYDSFAWNKLYSKVSFESPSHVDHPFIPDPFLVDLAHRPYSAYAIVTWCHCFH